MMPGDLKEDSIEEVGYVDAFLLEFGGHTQ
jgi:hypothetical protein